MFQLLPLSKIQTSTVDMPAIGALLLTLSPHTDTLSKYNMMNLVEQDKSVIQNLLHAWHKKKYIQCPTCKACIFHFDGTHYFSTLLVKYVIVLIHHPSCPSAIGNCGKSLFFCLSCGGQSSHTFRRLQDRGCKCVKSTAKQIGALLKRINQRIVGWQ